MTPAARLAERLGLPIRDLDLLGTALVHSSYLHEHPEGVVAHNERLEYLGDAVINLVVAEAFFRRHPADDEGALSARRANVVSAAGLASLATSIDLGALMLLGEGEAARGARSRPSLLASSLEAVVGAVYLDLGWEATRDWFLAFAGDELTADLPAASLKSPKSRLQELLQRTGGQRPVYRLVEATGPDHARTFTVEVVAGETAVGRGTGANRREADTAAAKDALTRLEGEEPR